MQNEISAEEIWQKDKDHFIHPYADFATFKKEGSHIISKAHGAYIVDSHGHTILDGIGGLWCVNIGHGRQEMADSIAAQVLNMEYYNPFGHTTNAPAALLAAKLAELAPGNLNHVFYASSGSVANDLSVRIIHLYFNQIGKPSKKKIISRIDGYHGATYLAASLTGIHETKKGFDQVTDFVEHVSAANMYRRQDGMSESDYCDYLVKEFEDRILQLGPDNVAAFIAEPIMGAGGVLVAPKGYHQRMWQVCKKYDVLYVADEVVTAFGRLGYMFASKDVTGIEPDIINTAKGLTSGYIPLSATLISDEIYEVISNPKIEGSGMTMGFTYSGHPVGCAAALTNIEIIERENLCGHVQEMGPKFEKMMQELSISPIVGDVRGSHFMHGIELVADKVDKIGFTPEVDAAMRAYKKCLSRGVMIRPIGNLIVISPPLILTEEECQKIVTTLADCIGELVDELKAEGYLHAA